MFGSKGIVVEIRSHDVRGILYSSSFGRVGIEKGGSFPVEGGNTASAVDRLLSTFPAEAPVTLQLPGHLFMIRNVSLPFTDRKKIRKTLPFEMEGLLPLAADELLFDSIPSHSAEKGNNVMALSIPKKAVSGYLGLFPEGRKPVRVIPDLISLLSIGMSLRDEKSIYGVLNVENGASSMVLISGRKPVIMRSTPTGNDMPLMGDWIRSTIKPLDEAGAKIEALHVTGTGAQNAAPLLGEMTINISIPQAINGVPTEDWPAWAVLAGGAMSSAEFPWFNILGVSSERARFERILKAAWIGAAVLILLGTADLYLRYKTASQRLSALKAESKKAFLSVAPDVKRIVKEDAQLKDFLNKSKEMRETLIGKASVSYLAAVKGVEKVVMERQDIRIREAVFEGDGVVIEGEGSGINADAVKKLFSEMEGAKEAHVEEMSQGINPNSYRFRARVELDKG